MALWLRYAVVFAIIFATSAIYNCYLLSNKTILLLDSSHYLITVRHLYAFCTQGLSGQIPQAWATLCSPQAAADIMIDGPILPALGVMGFLISGLAPQATNWSALAMVLSACLATMGCCVGITVENCIQKPQYRAIAGCVAALLAGINPEGLIAASRYLTELPSATILALIIALSSSVYFRKIGSWATYSIYLALPLLAFSGFLLKPALAFAYFLLPALILIRAGFSCEKKHFARIAAIMLCGLCAILIPWCAYTKQATGQIHLSPERMPLFNLAKGNDLAVDAYSSDPSAATSQQIERYGSVGQILADTWSRDPIGLGSLYLRKLQRVLVTPWNDFVQTPYGIPESITRLLHYYLVLSAVAGMVQSLAVIDSRRKYLFTALLTMIFASTLLLYLPFEGICRYSYPLSPLLFIFSALWHTDLLALRPASKAVKWYLATLFVCIVLLFCCDALGALQIALTPAILAIALSYATSTAYWLSTTRDITFAHASIGIKKSTRIFLALIVGCITLGAVTDPALYQSTQGIGVKRARVQISTIQSGIQRDKVNQHLLVLNLRPKSKDFSVSIASGTNSQILQPVLLHMLDAKTAGLANLNRMYSEIYGRNFQDFYQWYACPLPSKYVYGADDLTIKLSGCDLVHSRDKRDPHLSDWRYFSAGKLCNAPNSMDSRLSTSLPSHFMLPPISDKQSQPQIFICIARIRPTSRKADASCITNLKPTDFDPIFKTPEDASSLRIDKTRLKMASKVSTSVDLQTIPTGLNYLDLTLQGKLRRLSKQQDLGVLITLSNAKQSRSVVMPYCPASVKADSDLKPFRVNGLVNLQNIGFVPTSVDISFFPRDWPQYTLYGADRFCGSFEVKDLTLAVKYPDLPVLDLDDLISNRER